MGLIDSEYEFVCLIFGCEFNYIEIGFFFVMWLEYCSYKNFKLVFWKFFIEGK